MADKETKFTDEELQELRDLQTNYQQKVFDFGNLKVEKMLMEKRQAELDEREVELQEGWEGVQEQEREWTIRSNIRSIHSSSRARRRTRSIRLIS